MALFLRLMKLCVTVREDDIKKQEIYKHLLQNGAKEIHMKSGMFGL